MKLAIILFLSLLLSSQTALAGLLSPLGKMGKYLSNMGSKEGWNNSALVRAVKKFRSTGESSSDWSWRYGGYLNKTARNGKTPLGRAVEAGSTVRMKILKGADPDKVSKISRFGTPPNIRLMSTPLGIAAGEGHVKVAKALLDSGADVNKVFDAGPYSGREGTALIEALNSSWGSFRYKANLDKKPHIRKEMVELLLDHGADPNLHVVEGDGLLSPLSLAIKRGLKPEIVDLLLKHGADPSLLTDREIYFAVKWNMYHVQKGRSWAFESLKMFLETGKVDLSKAVVEGEEKLLDIALREGHSSELMDILDGLVKKSGYIPTKIIT